ncbi:MAG: TolC family protein [Neisseriaceae bacterium]
MRVKHLLLAFVLLLGVEGCHLSPVPTLPKLSVPVQFDNVTSLPTHDADLEQWWKEWQDPTLTALIEEGLKNSPSIKKARQNMKLAIAYHAMVQADLWPMIGFSGRKTWGHGQIENSYLDDLNIGRTSTDIEARQLGLFSRWNVDLFGQKRNEAQSSYYNLLSAKEMFHAAQMSLSSRIAENYFNAIATHSQQQISQEALADLENLLRYTQRRFEAGETNPTEISELKARIAQLHSQQALLGAQLEQIEKSIAVLIGHTPQGYHVPYQKKVLDRNPSLPTGIKPDSLIYRRPDLMAKQRQICALTSKYKAAQADLFPKFYLNFGLLQGKLGISTFSKGLLSGPLWDIGVDLPIFTAGKIKAHIRATEAMLRSAFEDYDEALLSALQEVDSSYRWAEAYRDSVTQLLVTQQKLLKRSSDSQKLFKYGEFTYDKFLLNHLDFLKAREALIREKLNQARATILLYQALGGGWSQGEVSHPPSNHPNEAPRN